MQKKSRKKKCTLNRTLGGQFHRNEWTVVGAPCFVIKGMIERLSALLATKKIKTGLLDKEHKAHILECSQDLVLVDKIDSLRIDTKEPFYKHNYWNYLNHLDLVFINGNHYRGEKQILIINDKKKDVIKEQVGELTDVRMVVLDNGENEIPDYLRPLLNDSILVFKMDDVSEIASHILEDYVARIPSLIGLVLVGGKSQRMGEDKMLIDYHGKPQAIYEANLIKPFCTVTYLSVSTNSLSFDECEFDSIEDSFIGLGPFGGILSAFRKNPNSALLTIACDLPHLNPQTIEQLVKARKPSKLATCFFNAETNLPEPLLTIWEPRAYSVMLHYLSQGYSNPRMILANSNVELIELEDQLSIKNANTPEERKRAIDLINRDQYL